MAWTFTCDDGVVISAETREELRAAMEAHVRDLHPDLVGKVNVEDLLARAQQV
jgi:hypothetical protein